MKIDSQYTLINTNSEEHIYPSFLRKLWNALVNSLIFFYSGLFIAYQIALHTPIGDLWWLRFVDIFGYFFYLPLPFLLPFLLFPHKRKSRSLALIIPLLFFVYEYGAAFTPRLQLASLAIAQADIPVRVMTWNTYFDNPKVENLVKAVAQEKPDILAVEEFGALYAKEFAEALKAEYPYQLVYPSWKPTGYAVFSRYPLQELLQPLPGFGACPCVQAGVTIKDRQVTVIVIHPTIPYMEINFDRRLPRLQAFDTYRQDIQHEAVLRRAATVKTPLLLLGDFNATDRMPILNGYRAVLTDAFGEAGFGFGFSFPYNATFRSISLPSFVRLDYIFHDASWRTLRSWMGQAEGADHRYVVADLVLAAP